MRSAKALRKCHDIRAGVKFSKMPPVNFIRVVGGLTWNGSNEQKQKPYFGKPKFEVVRF